MYLPIRFSPSVQLKCKDCGQKNVVFFAKELFCTFCGWSRPRAYPSGE